MGLRLWRGMASCLSRIRVCILSYFYVFTLSWPNHPTFPEPRSASSKPSINWKATIQSNQDFQNQLQVYLDAVTPERDAAAVSVERTLLAQELRSDGQYGVGGRPLRLLSLGSSLFRLMEVVQMKAVDAEYPFSIGSERHYGQDWAWSKRGANRHQQTP